MTRPLTTGDIKDPPPPPTDYGHIWISTFVLKGEWENKILCPVAYTGGNATMDPSPLLSGDVSPNAGPKLRLIYIHCEVLSPYKIKQIGISLVNINTTYWTTLFIYCYKCIEGPRAYKCCWNSSVQKVPLGEAPLCLKYPGCFYQRFIPKFPHILRFCLYVLYLLRVRPYLELTLVWA